MIVVWRQSTDQWWAPVYYFYISSPSALSSELGGVIISHRGLGWTRAGPTEEIPRPGHADTIRFASLWTLHWPLIGWHRSSVMSCQAKHPQTVLLSERKDLVAANTRSGVALYHFNFPISFPESFCWEGWEGPKVLLDCQQNLIRCRHPAELADQSEWLPVSAVVQSYILTSPPNFPQLVTGREAAPASGVCWAVSYFNRWSSVLAQYKYWPSLLGKNTEKLIRAPRQIRERPADAQLSLNILAFVKLTRRTNRKYHCGCGWNILREEAQFYQISFYL